MLFVMNVFSGVELLEEVLHTEILRGLFESFGFLQLVSLHKQRPMFGPRVLIHCFCSHTRTKKHCLLHHILLVIMAYSQKGQKKLLLIS